MAHLSGYLDLMAQELLADSRPVDGHGPAPFPHVRLAEEGDLEPVARLWTAAFVEGGQLPGAKPFAVSGAREAAASSLLGVAAVSGHVAGAVVLAPHGTAWAGMTGPGEAELRLLAVTPGHRGCGLGADLLGWCEQRARERGWSAIVLWSRPGQDAAHRLFERLEYERLMDLEHDRAGELVRVYRRAL